MLQSMKMKIIPHGPTENACIKNMKLIHKISVPYEIHSYYLNPFQTTNFKLFPTERVSESDLEPGTGFFPHFFQECPTFPRTMGEFFT